MLWLLPLDVGPVRVRLDPGAYVVPRWYDDMELGALVEVLRRVLEPAVMHAAILPVDALGTEAWVKSSPGGSGLIAVRGELDGERREELGRWAREHRHHMLVRARADEDELSTGWLERWIKPAVVWLLERGAWAEGHPLDAFDIDGLEPDRVARATEDPVEVLWLAERMLGHRLRYAEQGTGEQDYARSLRHAVGERCAERLRRCEGGVTAALDVIVGGMQSKDGWAALVGAGLGVWREGVLERGPLLRMVKEDWAAVEVIVGELGEDLLSAEAKPILWKRRRSIEEHERQTGHVGWLGTSDAITEGSLATALRQGMMHLLPDPVPLMMEIADAIERWERTRWGPEPAQDLLNMRLRLRGLLSAPSPPQRLMAILADKVLTIATTESSNELTAARAAVEQMRALSHEPLTGWELDLWLCAAIECSLRHQALATNKTELVYAEELYKTVIDLGTKHERPRRVAEARAHLADISARKGDLDAALNSLRREALPAFEALGDLRTPAVIKVRIADILLARGHFDQALQILEKEVLPIYDLLGNERARAIIRGKIADVLQARGEVEEALHIRLHQELPVFEQLGDVREGAITKLKIVDILQAKVTLMVR